MNVEAPRAKSVLQSPWYWAYAFCAAGLIALLLLGGKIAQRQSQIERQHQGRQRAHAHQQAAEKPAESPADKPAGASGRSSESAVEAAFADLSTPDTTIVSIEPLYVILGAVGTISWAVLWWTHFRRRNAAAIPREAP